MLEQPLTAFAFGKPLQLDSGDGIYMSEVTVTAFIESPSGGDPFEVGEKVKEFSFPVIDLEDSAGGSGWIPHETYRLLPEIAIDGTRPSSLADSPGLGLLKPDGSVWHLAAGGGSAGMFDVLKSRTDGDGWQLDQPNGSVLLFDAEGRLESFADRNGNERTYTYTDGNGDGESLELETITDVFGLTKTFHYAAGTLDKVVDFAGREWDYEVTGGKLRNVIWPKSEIGGGAGASWSLHYNEPDNPWLVTIVDPALGQTVFTFAEFTDHNIDPETGSDRTFDFFRLNGFTRADGAVRSVEPLKLMALATQETAPENPFYDVELPENIQSTAMFRQVSTTVKMDDFQQPVSTDSSDGYKTTQDRYENGLVQMFQPLVDNGVSPDYHYEYDARGRVELIKYPDGTTDDFLYGAKGQLEVHTDRLGRTTTNVLDLRGNALFVQYDIDLIGADISNNIGVPLTDDTNPIDRYDANGDGFVESQDALSVYSALVFYVNTGVLPDDLHWDVNGSGTLSALDVLTISNYLGDISTLLLGSFTYTQPGEGVPVGLLRTATDRRGLVTGYEYDDSGPAIGLLETVTVGDGLADPATYDPANPALITGEYERTTQFFYDDRRNLESTIDPLGRLSVTLHDQLDRPFEVRTFQSETGDAWSVTNIEYDVLGAVFATSEAITYESETPLQRRTEFTERDPLSRPKWVKLPEINGALPELHYTYVDGFLATFQDQLGRVTEYDFVDGRLDEVRSPGATDGAVLTTNYEYRLSGETKKIESTAQDGKLLASQSWIFDEEGRVKHAEHLGADDTMISETSKYDAVGRRYEYHDERGNISTFKYDDLDRLILETLPYEPLSSIRDTVTSYYDAAGSIAGTRDPLGHFTVRSLNVLGETLSVTSPDPDGSGARTPLVSTVHRDQVGLPHEEFAPSDNYGRQVKINSERDEYGLLTGTLVTHTAATVPDCAR